MPSRFRSGLGEPFVVTRGLDGCLFCYPRQVWQSITSQLDSLPFTASGPRAFGRLFYSGAVEVSPDKQGRFLLPQALREHAALGKELVVIGVSNRVEIWSADRWAEYRARAERDYQALAENLFRS
jgi:MraZ protein